MKQDWRVDPLLLLLAGVMVFLVTALVLVAWLLPANMALFVAISGLLGSASGSFFTHMPPAPPNPPKDSTPPNEVNK